MERTMLTSKDYNDALRQVEEMIEAKIASDGGLAYASCAELLGELTMNLGLYTKEVQDNSNIKYRINELISIAAICVIGAASIESGSVDG